MSYLTKLLQSFTNAVKGIVKTIGSEQNMRIHVLAAIVVIAAGIFFRISTVEWCLIIFAIGMVMSAEAFNTSIESLADLIQPERHPLAGKAKDIAAGAVLIAALTATAVGILIFGKYFLL